MGAVSRATGRDSSSIQAIAHRRSSKDAPEHTLSAYKRALDDGADALECDVRLTRDGHLVCVHDRPGGRTSNRRGAVPPRWPARPTARGVARRVGLAALAAWRFGSGRGRGGDFGDPEVPARDGAEI